MVAPAVQASSLTAFQARAQRCLEAGHHQLCQQALLEAEALQRRASARSAYPCQTLLLGVQADLIMQQLKAGRGAEAVVDWRPNTSWQRTRCVSESHWLHYSAYGL